MGSLSQGISHHHGLAFFSGVIGGFSAIVLKIAMSGGYYSKIFGVLAVILCNAISWYLSAVALRKLNASSNAAIAMSGIYILNIMASRVFSDEFQDNWYFGIILVFLGTLLASSG